MTDRSQTAGDKAPMPARGEVYSASHIARGGEHIPWPVRLALDADEDAEPIQRIDPIPPSDPTPRPPR